MSMEGEERTPMTCPFCGEEMELGKLRIKLEGACSPLERYLLRWYGLTELEKRGFKHLQREFIPLKRSDTDDRYHSNAWACGQCQKVITVFDMDGPPQSVWHPK